LTALSALRGQLAKLEESSDLAGGPDYVSKFREFKYQETLFELFARQYELARLDESREGALVQVVDPAKPAEWKSRPKRAVLSITAGLLALILLGVFVVSRHLWRSAAARPETAARLANFRAALSRR
jgi:uncharacterized protein involved in exopolysaccharide biosynthesis